MDLLSKSVNVRTHYHLNFRKTAWFSELVSILRRWIAKRFSVCEITSNGPRLHYNKLLICIVITLFGVKILTRIDTLGSHFTIMWSEAHHVISCFGTDRCIDEHHSGKSDSTGFRSIGYKNPFFGPRHFIPTARNMLCGQSEDVTSIEDGYTNIL